MSGTAATGGGGGGIESHWIQRATLVDSRTSVNDAKFSPRHLGLLLVMESYLTDSHL